MSSGSTPRVFISYAHDSPEHRDRVLGFASFLRAQGIDAVLDTWYEGDPRDWYAWAIKELTDADYVLVIASARYRQVGDGSAPSGLHKGVQSEAALLRDLIYGDRDRWRPKVLPVLLNGHGVADIPLFLQPNTASHYEVSALTVTGADSLLRVILRQPAHVPPPVAPRPELPPTGWGAFDRLPAQIQDLLRAQESIAADLPYRLRGARQHSLGTVYVRQELGTGTDAPRPEQPRTEPYRDGKVPVSLPEPPTVRLVVRPPARPIRAALDANDHLLITGGPGQGKSTLSLRLTADIAASLATAPEDDTTPLTEPVIPLRLTARELAARRDLPFAQVLAECVRAEYGGLLSTDVSATLLADRVAGRRWLLLVDGLDEVADAADRDRLVKVLAARASEESPYRVVLTTRPIEGAALAPFQQAGAARYELQPFDEAALNDFARNWFATEGPDTADRFVRQIRAAHLDELVRVPLLATIAAIIFSEYRDVPLPDNQYELYQAYLEFLRSGRPVCGTPFDELRTPLLEHLGRIRLETDAPLLASALTWYAQRVSLAARPVNWRDDLATFLTAVGPLALRGDELRFLHHSFAEHLAATSMARDLPAEFAEDHPSFTHLLYTARDGIRGRYPRTVLLHYTRLRPDQSDRLMRRLHTGTPEDQLLAARLLAKHAPASASVVDKFLATTRTWAMTNQYPSGSILEEVTRATHHPGLVPWLVKLSTDEKAPWPSRVIAATALASQPGEPHTDAAADLLEAVVHNADLSVTDRLDAAEGLVDCGLGRRAAAEQGLRLVLSDPSTPAGRRRAATVVLASLGPHARAFAVDSLLTRLDDPWTPVEHLVEAATALAEIGLEFHERCATEFRSVLRATGIWTGFRDAARGLAALGPQYVNEAAEALTAFAGNRANEYFNRAQAAETLRELGPMFGVAAGDLVLGMLAEPATWIHEQVWYFNTLARLGPDHRATAATLLRARLDKASHDDLYHLFEGMIELGPEFHEEAALELRRVAEDPLHDGPTRILRLGRLARLGQVHSSYASDRLRAQVGDRRLDVDTRIWAARELARLGPEFHLEVKEFLVTTAKTGSPENEQVPFACSLLADLNAEHRDLAARTLVDLLQSRRLNSDSLLAAAHSLSDLGPTYRLAASKLLADILNDRARPDRQCIAAAQALVRLGGEYDRCALAGLLDLLRQENVDLEVGYYWTTFYSMGAGPRRQLADALHAHIAAPQAGPQRIVGLARIISRLSDDHAAIAVQALETVLADDTSIPQPRFDAAVALVALRPERRAAAVSVIKRCVHPVNIFWTLRGASTALAELGHDPISLLEKVLADDNAERELRETAAALLPDFDPDAGDHAVAELRHQSRDDHLDYRARGDILMRLAEADNTAIDEALAFQRRIIDDDEQPVPDRCHAAEQAVRLDRALWSDAVALARRLLTEPFSTAEDRHAAVLCMDKLNAMGANEKQNIAGALVWDPALSSVDRKAAIDLLRGQMRLDAQRLQLADHRAWITDRVPAGRTYFDTPPLPAETEAVIRDVLAAPETSTRERTMAAAELAGLSLRLMPEAAEILARIVERDIRARFSASRQLAWLDGPYRPMAVRRIEAMVTDEAIPARTRRLVAENLIVIDYNANPIAIDFLHTVVADQDLPGICRINAMYTLRHVDGPEPMRALRDDPRLAPAVRVEAAGKLIAFTADDRASAAGLLDRIGADQTVRPALRLRAVDTLGTLGAPGRRQAMGILAEMLNDGTVPATSRARAGGQLAEICPARRPQVIRALLKIQGQVSSLHRIRVLAELGKLRPEEATPLLRALTEDRALRAVTRLRAAEELARFRMDQREAAAVVARELMSDERVPWHVRRSAACDLAMWSLLCREEARDMIRHIDGTYRAVRALGAS